MALFSGPTPGFLFPLPVSFPIFRPDPVFPIGISRPDPGLFVFKGFGGIGQGSLQRLIAHGQQDDHQHRSRQERPH